MLELTTANQQNNLKTVKHHYKAASNTWLAV